MRQWSRRAFLRASAIAAGVVATPVGRALAAPPPALSRASRVFLHRGLFVGAVLKKEMPSETQWRGSACNTATLDGSYVPPVYARQWALAAYSTGGLPDTDRLFTICFGNSEPYSQRVVDRLSHSFALMHSRHPDVLVHSNHVAGEWSENELRSYVRKAKPDLLTFSMHHFRASDIYDALAVYRQIALDGNDAIAFGHYGAGCTTDELSDAELNMDCFAAWTMGARWINLFRWNSTDAARFAGIARESSRLSPFLVRLTSTDVRAVQFGRRPRRVPAWDSFAGPYIDSITGTEILIGYFRPIVNLGGQLAGKYVKPFMLHNGSIERTQDITVSLIRLGNRLVRVNRGTGRLERIRLRTGNIDEFTVTIEPGAADLFFLTTGPTYDDPPVVNATADPRAIQPGDEFTVNVIAKNDTVDQPMPDAQARLLAPPGWSSEPDGSIRLGDLAPGTTGTTAWRVTAPTNTDAGKYQLTVEITYQYAPNTDVRGGARAYLAIPVPYNSLSDDFTNVAVSDDSAPTSGDIDGAGNSYSALALSVAGITPGSTVTAAGISFTWPDFPAGQPDNVIASGQAFMLGESGARIGFLGCCTDGTTSGAGRILYSDGSEQPYKLSYPDWYGTPPAKANIAAHMPYRNSPAGADNSPVNIYVATVDIDPTKTVDTVILPDIQALSDRATMHIFAIAID